MNQNFKEFFYESIDSSIIIDESLKTSAQKLATAALIGGTAALGLGAENKEIIKNPSSIEQSVVKDVKYKVPNINNPGNIRYNSANDWVGQIKPNKSFCQFDTIEHGIRANIKTLKTYYNKYNINTIETIFSRYAPEKDNNNTKVYISNVEKWIGVSKDKPLNIFNDITTKEEKRELLFKLLYSIFRQENSIVLPSEIIYKVIDQNI